MSPLLKTIVVNEVTWICSILPETRFMVSSLLSYFCNTGLSTIPDCEGLHCPSTDDPLHSGLFCDCMETNATVCKSEYLIQKVEPKRYTQKIYQTSESFHCIFVAFLKMLKSCFFLIESCQSSILLQPIEVTRTHQR